jgi:hypothetical protein
MEIFIVIIIIGLATAYIVKTFYNKYKTTKAGGTNCACSSCDAGSACCEPKKTDDDLNG